MMLKITIQNTPMIKKITKLFIFIISEEQAPVMPTIPMLGKT
jgi:hypothetical protein